MKNNNWVIGVALIAIGILFLFTQGTRGEMQSSGIGRYQLSQDDDSGLFVWKIDTVTGTVSKCQGGSDALYGCWRIMNEYQGE